MSAEQFRDLMLKRWRLVAACLVVVELGVLAGGLFVKTSVESQAYARLLVGNGFATSSYMATVVADATSPGVLGPIAAKHAMTTDMLAKEVTAAIEGGSQVIRVTVTDTDSSRASALAGSISQGLVASEAQLAQQRQQPAVQFLQSQITATQTQISTLSDTLTQQENNGAGPSALASTEGQLSELRTRQALFEYSLVQVQAAQAVDGTPLTQFGDVGLAPVSGSSRLVLYATRFVGGLVFGLLLGIVLALLIDRVDQRVRSIDAVSRLLGWPALATMSDMAAASKSLDANMAFLGIDRPIRSLVVATADAAERGSDAAADIVRALAAGGRSVVLVDANLRNPSQGRRFGIQAQNGLTSAALAFNTPTGSASVGQFLYPIGSGSKPSLWVMPAGPLPPNPAQLLRSRAVGDVAKALADGAELVVFDAPALLDAPDAALLATNTDGLVVAVDLDRARRSSLLRMKAQLTAGEATILGFIVAGPGLSVGQPTPVYATPKP